MNQDNKPLADQISEQIKSNKLKMKPRGYFVAGSLILGIGLAGVITIALFFIGVLVFRFRVHAPFEYLRFGSGGLTPFFHNLPWAPFLISIVGIVAGLYMIKRFNIGYRHVFIGVAIGFVLTLTIFGLILDVAGLPEKIQDVEPFESFFQKEFYGDTWVVGLVEEVGNNEMIVVQPDGIRMLITLDKETTINPPVEVRAGEIIRVIGCIEDDQFVAEAIRHGEPPRGGPFNLNKIPNEVRGKCWGPGCSK